MVHNVFIEVGRVAYVTYGPSRGQLVVILDICDASKVLVEGAHLHGPHHKQVARQLMPVKRLRLTSFKIKAVKKNMKSKDLKKAADDYKLSEKWEKTAIVKRLNTQRTRAKLTDYERFKVFALRRELSKKVRTWANANLKKKVQAPQKKK